MGKGHQQAIHRGNHIWKMLNLTHILEIQIKTMREQTSAHLVGKDGKWQCCEAVGKEIFLFTANWSVEWVNVLRVQFGNIYQFYFYEFILQKYLPRCPKMYIQRMFTVAMSEEWKTGKNPNVYPLGI